MLVLQQNKSIITTTTPIFILLLLIVIISILSLSVSVLSQPSPRCIESSNSNSLYLGPSSYFIYDNPGYELDLRSSSWTFTSWIKRTISVSDPAQNPEGSTQPFQTIINQGLVWKPYEYMHWGFRTDDYYSIDFWSGGVNSASPITNFNEWHHYAVQYIYNSDTDSGQQYLYIDGVQLATTAATINDPTVTSPPAGSGHPPYYPYRAVGPIRFGAKEDGTSNLNSYLTDIRIYNRILSPTELMGISSKCQLDPADTNLIMYYSLSNTDSMTTDGIVEDSRLIQDPARNANIYGRAWRVEPLKPTTAPTPTPTPTPTDRPGASTGGNVIPGAPTSVPTNTDSGSSSGGISSNTVIAIAVAAGGVGLLLIIGTILFCCRSNNADKTVITGPYTQRIIEPINPNGPAPVYRVPPQPIQHSAIDINEPVVAAAAGGVGVIPRPPVPIIHLPITPAVAASAVVGAGVATGIASSAVKGAVSGGSTVAKSAGAHIHPKARVPGSSVSSSSSLGQISAQAQPQPQQIQSQQLQSQPHPQPQPQQQYNNRSLQLNQQPQAQGFEVEGIEPGSDNLGFIQRPGLYNGFQLSDLNENLDLNSHPGAGADEANNPEFDDNNNNNNAKINNNRGGIDTSTDDVPEGQPQRSIDNNNSNNGPRIKRGGSRTAANLGYPGANYYHQHYDQPPPSYSTNA